MTLTEDDLTEAGYTAAGGVWTQQFGTVSVTIDTAQRLISVTRTFPDDDAVFVHTDDDGSEFTLNASEEYVQDVETVSDGLVSLGFPQDQSFCSGPGMTVWSRGF